MSSGAFARTGKPGRVRVPSILQMEEVECGAASLAMILAHHGRWVSLEDVRRLCGVSRDGTKASSMLKAARQYGLSARGFRKGPEGLQDLPVPSIIHWNFNHFLVYEGRRGDRIFLNDPARGPREVTAAELDESFTGVVLAFEQGPDFQPGGVPPRGWGHLFGYLAPNRAVVGLVALLSLFLVIPGVIMPGLTRVFIDDVLVPARDDWVSIIVIALLLTGAVNTLVTWLQQHYLLRLEGKMAISIASRYVHRILGLPATFFLQRSVGDLVNRVGAAERIGQLLSGTLAQNVFNLLSVIFFAAAMAVFDWVLALLGVLLAVLNVVAVRLLRAPRETAARKLRQDQGKLMSAASGSIRALETLKSSGGEQDAFTRFSGFQAHVLGSRQELGTTSALLQAAPGLMGVLTTTAILGFGGMRVMDGVLTIGSLIAIQALMARFTQPIEGLVSLAGDIQSIRADLARLDDADNYPVPEPAAVVHGDYEEPAGHVSIRGLSYGHAPLDPPLIRDLDLELAPGARVALVGGSGSGKSTVGRLLAGLFEPWEGEIRIDGRALAEIPPEHLSACLAHVDQDIFLFAGTIRDNLTLWDHAIPDAVLTRALQDACLDDEIRLRTGYLDARVEEGGANFSGGQRQRLELARALVQDPAVLILDEATSALDPVTEQEIDNHLRRRGCACLIIAHRLSTVRDADEILVLEQGQVVERGTHEQLLEREGRYAELVRTHD